MTGLTATDLTFIRSTVSELLPDTCTLQSPTETADAMGGWTTTYATAHASVPCRMWRKSGGEREVGSKTAEVTSWVLTVAYDQALNATMRVIHGGHTYQVNEVNDTGSEREGRRASCTRIV